MEQLMQLLKEGVTPSHVVEFVKQDLIKNGFHELNFDEAWSLKDNEKYYVNLYGTNTCAFRLGKMTGKTPQLRIALSHSDYPCFVVKPNPVIDGKHESKLNVEIYGGMYQKSWLDRPLGIAGNVIVKGKDAFFPKTLLYRSKQAMCIIPSLAIHMDRELNKKGALDTAKELVPILALSAKEDLLERIATELSIEKDEILDYDLSLYNMESPTLVGMNQEMLVSPKLDNLTSIAASLYGLEKCEYVPDDTIDIMMVFDNEEVGSLSKQGADSEVMPVLIEKILETKLQSGFEKSDVLTKSFILSVDVAHANHPNYEEKSDATSKAVLGSGFCLKRSVGQKYGTTSSSAAVVKQLAKDANIPYTIAINKTGIAGGSTLGPIVTSHLSAPCADIGMPILAMHSATETGAVADYEALKHFLKIFFEK